MEPDPTGVLSMLVNNYFRDKNNEEPLLSFFRNKDICNTNIILDSKDVNQERFVALLSSIVHTTEGTSALAWAAFTMIEALCSAHRSVSKNLKKSLVSCVVKVMTMAVTEEKKLRVLTVLQTLTYGIQMQMMEDFVSPLFERCAEWCTSKHDITIVNLSLSILVNMLHGNRICLPALIRTINVKELMKEVLHIRKDVVCRMETSKLMLLLEDVIYEKPSNEDLMNFVKVTFTTLISSTSTYKIDLIHHSIDFFHQMVQNGKITGEILSESGLIDSVERILEILETVDSSEVGMLLFKFLGVIVDMKIPSVSVVHDKIKGYAIKWVRNHSRCSESLNILHILFKQNPTMNIETEDLQIFLQLLNGQASSDIEYETQISLFKLLQSYQDVPEIDSLMQMYLKEEMIEPFLLGLKNVKLHALSESCISMYVHFADFLSKLLTCVSWMQLGQNLFRNRQMLSILAIALLNGECDLKVKVFSLIGACGFPNESIGLLAKGVHNITIGQFPILGDSYEFVNPQSPVNPSITHEIKKLVDSLKRLRLENKLQDSSLIQILQLYEFKDEASLNYQASLVSSLTKASEQINLIQNQLHAMKDITSKLRTELYCVRPALDDVRNKYDDALKTIKLKEEEVSLIKSKHDQEITSIKETIVSLNMSLELAKRDNENIKHLKEKLTEMNKSYMTLIEENGKMEAKSNELQEVVNATTVQLNAKDEIIEKLTLTKVNLEKEVQHFESTFESKDKQIKELQLEIQNLHHLKDTIFKLTSNSKKF